MPLRPLASGPLATWILPLFLVGCETAKIDFTETGDPIGDDTQDTDEPDTVADGALSASPAALDFGVAFLGAAATLDVTVTNVGDGPVELAGLVDSAEFTLGTVTSPGPGESVVVSVTWTPATIGAASASLTLSDALGDGTVTIPITGQAQEDADGDGYGSLASGGDDCDDANAAAHPGAAEVWYDGVDEDCLGGDDYDRDADGADYTVDCDEDDATVYPGATETWYDGVDSDCAGDDDFDQDADGYVVGVDCDDTAAPVNPGATETWYDGVDQDCDGVDDDQDLDGYGIADDCDDLDATIHPGATETWYDGVDQDCAGDDDYDQDGDGVTYDTDCNDTDASTTGPVTETLDGLDTDCDGVVDDVAIADVASGVLYGGASGLGLGDADGLSLGGDLTGDGADDVVVASDASGNGYAFVVSGATAATAAGNVDSYDTAAITGQSTYYPMGNLVGPMVDVTGDGTEDLLIAGSLASYYYNYGRGWVLTGGGSLAGSLSTSSTYSARFDGDSDDDLLSWLAAGDLDGDGAVDVVTGAPDDNYTSGSWSADYDSGNVAVYSGTVSGSYDISDSDDQVHGSDDYDYLGSSLYVADLDDDGYADILAGAYGNDDGASDGGAVYLFSGNASLSWDTRADDAAEARVLGDAYHSYLGYHPLTAPGDVDGDGALDLALGSESVGEAWLFWDVATLSGDVETGSADLAFTGSSSSFASALAYASDLDGDGAAELYIGDSGDDTAASNAGAVWMFTPTAGSSGAWTSADASAVFWGAAADDELGSGLAGGGDADGDGNDDLLVGATGSDGAASGGGAVYVVLGW